MNLDDYTRQMQADIARLSEDIVISLSCKIYSSEGKYQPHDWSDIYRRPGLAYGLPVLKSYRRCLREGCDYVVRVRRRG